MSTTTPRAKLTKPDNNEREWGDLANANFDALDAANAIGAFAVARGTAALTLDVATGTYVKVDGAFATYAGAAAVSVPASATTLYWLTDAGVLTAGSAWPTTPHIRLASVVANSVVVTTIADARTPYRTTAPAQGPFTSTYGGASTALGSSPTLADLTAYVNSLATAMKASGAIR